jgi:PBP1b-binding outer membrane lipoprotein LpoB
MRRLVVAIAVVALVLVLAGCSGGSSSSSAPASSSAAPVAVGVPAAVLPDIVNRSANNTDTFVPFPTGDAVPPELKQKILVDKQPTIIYFYDSTQKVSAEVRNIIDAVRNQNRGMVDLVAYDIGKYVTANPDGTMVVDPALATDPNAKAAVIFARDPSIAVPFTPFIVLTDGQGMIIYKHHGLVDQAFLEREVLRATR